MGRVISVYLPTWPTDRLRRTRGDAPPLGKPFATVVQDGARRIIASADATAWDAGLRPGMAVAHANALVAGLALADARPEADKEGLARLADWAARRFSPIAAPDPPDGLVIDATGCAHLFGGEAALLDRIVNCFDRAHVAARAAIADTLGGAGAMARFGDVLRTAIVAPGRTAEILAPLPAAALRIDPEVAAELRRFGLKRIAQLLGAPRAPLLLRFGEDLGRRLDQALGRAPELITPVIPKDAPRCRTRFLEPIVTSEALAHVTHRLVAELCGALAAESLGARRLDLLFERVDQTTVVLCAGTAKPSRDPHHLARLLVDRLDAEDLGFGVEAMTLIASTTERLDARQITAEGMGGENDADIAELKDLLLASPRVAGVHAIAPVQSHVPERTVHLTDPLAADAKDASWPKAWPRPYWLFQPEPVETLALLPDAPPAHFVWRGRAHRVRRADGPERIHLEWWRAPSEIRATRDYYRVEDEDGGRYWLFREGRTNDMRWFLHGVFG